MPYATVAALNAETARAKAAEAGLQAQINALKPTPPATGQPLTYIPTPAMPVPGYLAPVTDPVSGSKVIRVSNIAGLRHAYARIQPWNADSSKILLGFTPSSARIVDGTTYADRYPFHPVPYALWSNKDPNVIYGATGNALVRQDATTGAVTVIRDFGAVVSIGNYEGGISDDDSRLALSAGGMLYVVEPSTGVTVTQSTLPAGLDNFQISRDGVAVVLVGGTTRSQPLIGPPVALYGLANHGDNAADGRFVANNCPGVKSFDVVSGAGTTLIPPGSAFEYGHTSGRGPRPVLSNYDTGITAGRSGHDQIVAVNPDGTVQLYGFAHHTTAQDGSAAAYMSQPQACPSRDGKRVIFASDWGAGSVYAYVAELP